MCGDIEGQSITPVVKLACLLGGSWAVTRVPLRVPLKGSTGILERYRALSLLGSSWIVIGGVICPLIWVIIIVTLLITPLITTHEATSTCAVS